MSKVTIYLKGRSVSELLPSIDEILDRGDAVVLRKGSPRRRYHPGRSHKVARLSVGESFEAPYLDDLDWLSWRTLVSTTIKECGMECSVNKIENTLVITRVR